MRGPTFISQGPRTTLSRRGRAWVPDAPCATLSQRYDLPASLVLALVLAHDHPYPSPSPRLFPLAYSRSQRGPTPRGAPRRLVVSRVLFALTGFPLAANSAEHSRRHSKLSSLPGRRHDYDLLTWTTVSDRGPPLGTTVPGSRDRGMEAANPSFC